VSSPVCDSEYPDQPGRHATLSVSFGGAGWAQAGLRRAACIAGAWAVLALFGSGLVSPAPADETSNAALNRAQQSALAANPTEMMAAMASELDRNGNVVVLMLADKPITQADMADVVRTMPVNFASLGFGEVSRRALDVLVSQKAMALDAQKEGLDKDPAVIRGGKAAVERALADAWLTRHGNAAVTDAALHARYDSEIAGKPGPEEVRARVILCPTEQEAGSVLAKAKAGADFEALAKTYSKAPNASMGGDLGYATLDALAPEIGPVVFALPPGQMSAYPVRSPVGYFIVRVEGRRQRGTPTFDEAKPRLEGELRGEAAQTMIHAVLEHLKLVQVANPDGAGSPSVRQTGSGQDAAGSH
jgi:peptidyl-prolyl cis-trans isomerase C